MMKHIALILLLVSSQALAESSIRSGSDSKLQATARMNFKVVIPAVIKVVVPAEGQTIVATNVPRGRVSIYQEDVYEHTMIASSGNFLLPPPVRYITGALP